MDWSGRRVLVTGGAGFLGANLCHELARRGARVIALDGFLFGGGANPANLNPLPPVERCSSVIRLSRCVPSGLTWNTWALRRSWSESMTISK